MKQEPIRIREISKEVFVTDEPIVRVSRREIEFLKERVRLAPRGRVRLCAHASNDDPLHEMMIVLSRETYIRPHKHHDKSESFHVIEGRVDLVILDDHGAVTKVLELGDLASGRSFYHRLSQPLFHTLLIRTELLVIHETTNGPFKPGDAILAPWAPEEGAAAARGYVEELDRAAARSACGA
jgi:cupin fold WbuC family metalloprotein